MERTAFPTSRTIDEPFNAFFNDSDAYLKGTLDLDSSGLPFPVNNIFNVDKHLIRGVNPDWKTTH